MAILKNASKDDQVAAPPKQVQEKRKELQERADKLEVENDAVANEVLNLEEQFQKEIGSTQTKPSPQPVRNSLQTKKTELAALEAEIDEEIEALENTAKQEIVKLKEVKQGIEGKLAELKELRGVKGKIEEELKKIGDLEERQRVLEKEIESIEKDVHGE